ncbi:dihydromonapterin reductase [Agarivorans sp. B2Z047]|uniref:dihydromonapterin reductase n=1 Tax=Agarivorans sp. B2Z047 TaxID=2652721 RepID=UPI00128E0E20|nr:dihydromonapterin reductase [Agarivorans sp. B2Z047]MPW30364.1 dihydromonapterin reductase [Agarivorans sp. B2Z047]UQN43007.1 dihydromonapterin reductase [Agarivorans sp. B2Z047]
MPSKLANSSAPVLITGGTQRLGLAIAEDLLQQGYSVIVTYRSDKAAVQALRDKGADCIIADFSDEQGISQFIAYVLENYSALRAVIHNASQWLNNTALDNQHQLMQAMWSVHVSAPYQLNIAFEELLKNHQDQQASDIIHMTDYVADKGSSKHIAYAASKAGLANLTHSFAAKLAPAVKVNSIAPSLLMFNQDDPPEYRTKALAKSLMALEPGASEAVAAVNYLLASKYITGRTIGLDGGRHLV